MRPCLPRPSAISPSMRVEGSSSRPRHACVSSWLRAAAILAAVILACGGCADREKSKQGSKTVVDEPELSVETVDTRLGEKGASVESVDFEGGDFTAIEEIWASQDGPMTASDRVYVGGEWRSKPKGYARTLGRPSGGVLLSGAKGLWMDSSGKQGRTFTMPTAGFPVMVLSDSIVYSVDEDDGGEDASDSDLLSEGIFATNFDGKIVWRAATDSDAGLRGAVFSIYGATRTARDTALTARDTALDD